MTVNEYVKKRFGRFMDQCTNEEIYVALLEYVKKAAKEKGCVFKQRFGRILRHENAEQFSTRRFQMSEVIVITSGKGGVGKTTTAANIGIGLAQLGKKVVMVDTDIGLRNLDVVLGLENRIVYNLVDVVEGNCRMKQALIRDKRYEQLYLLPSAQTRDKTSVTPEQMKKLCDELKQSFEFVLLDLYFYPQEII